MRIYHSLEEYVADRDPVKKSCVALGKFDGLHRGHLKLIRRVLDAAASEDTQSVLFAIEVNSDGILSHEERARILDDLGMDVLIECPFSRSFMEMTPEQFIETILSDTLHASYVAVGTDYRFGHNRSGDALVLQYSGPSFGYSTDIVEKETYLSEEISSSRVRDALSAGDMELVRALLGREYRISGIVQHGRHIGTSIGMPTVNLTPPEDKILPGDGVYVSMTELPDGTRFKGLTNIGFRPTVRGTHRTIETTLLDYSGNLYGSGITVSPVHFLRNEIRFDSLEELKAQIEKDKVSALSFTT